MRASRGRDLWIWAAAVGLGGLLTVAMVRLHAPLGTSAAPFLGSYRFNLGVASLLAPALAVAVLVLTARGWLERLAWPALLAAGWAGSLAWSLALALVDGEAGLTRSLTSADNYLTDLPGVGDDPAGYVASYTADAAAHSVTARGHPPGPVLLLWTLHRFGLDDQLFLGLLIAGLGALITPLVLASVRGVCGETQARRYAVVLILAPYAVWVAVSVDVAVAVLLAAMVALGVAATSRRRPGWARALLALASGLVLGVAALFSYAAPWLGLSAVCLYFARRRPFLPIATGIGALVPVLGAQFAGFSWVAGLLMAREDFETRVEPERSAAAWAAINLVVLLLAAGPPLIRSIRRLRNTAGWPFLVGAAAAVLFDLLAGVARGGAEVTWLSFYPWLTVAAVAPTAQAGPDPEPPLALVAVGAATAIVVQAVLATPW